MCVFCAVERSSASGLQGIIPSGFVSNVTTDADGVTRSSIQLQFVDLATGEAFTGPEQDAGPLLSDGHVGSGGGEAQAHDESHMLNGSALQSPWPPSTVNRSGAVVQTPNTVRIAAAPLSYTPYSPDARPPMPPRRVEDLVHSVDFSARKPIAVQSASASFTGTSPTLTSAPAPPTFTTPSAGFAVAEGSYEDDSHVHVEYPLVDATPSATSTASGTIGMSNVEIMMRELALRAQRL